MTEAQDDNGESREEIDKTARVKPQVSSKDTLTQIARKTAIKESASREMVLIIWFEI
jgi:hypothetical protein